MKGKLIVIEGLDGCGKNTQAKLLVKFLKNQNKKVKYLSFPDYNEPSSSLIKMYLNREFGENPDAVNAYAASSFYAVDRYASYKKFWEKNYKSGEIIICDRYTTSNTFYQMSKLSKTEWENYLTWLYDYEYNKLGLPKPYNVIFLNVPVEVSQNLMKKRYSGDDSKKDLHEANIEFLKNCKEAAKYVIRKDNWTEISCTKENKMRKIEDIHSEIVKNINI